MLLNGNNTGYAVAKGISKALANVYEAVEDLSSVRVIEITIGNSKICHPTPWQQVFIN